MDLQALVTALGSGGALLIIIRVLKRAWSKFTSTSPDVERHWPRATTWLRKVAAHFFWKRVKRRWALYYAMTVYLKIVFARHERLIVPGKVELSTDRCYIPLELRNHQGGEGPQLLDGSGTVLLLGDPGAGKSALLSRLIRELSRRARRDRAVARLPIYVPLQHIVPHISDNQHKEISPDDALAILNRWFEEEYIKPLGLYDSGDMLPTLAQSRRNGLVLLLDGLDEVNSEAFPLLEDFLLALARYLVVAPGRNLLVVASRRQALDFVPRITAVHDFDATTVELEPFTPAGIYSFLLRWPYSHSTKAHAETQRIFRQLRLNPTLMETCANPLALALYVNHDLRRRARGHDGGTSEPEIQPETRAEFFSEVIDYLMIRTRAVKVPIRPIRQIRISFFVTIVDNHIKSAQEFNRIDHDMMLKGATTLARTGQDAEEALMDLAKDTGVITRNVDGTWRFVHRSFLDYFLARSLTAVRKRAVQRLLDLVRDEPLRYLEGFYLACGLMASRDSPNLSPLLRALGNSAFVGRYFPKAMLEAQTYYIDDFVERIRFYCQLWKRDKSDGALFRDLVSVLVDYENYCHAVGREPEVTVVEQFGGEVGTGSLPLLQAALLDAELAMRMAGGSDMASILLGSPTEDAIVALYDPSVSEQLTEADIDSNPRLAAIVSETALRSSLLAGHLARRAAMPRSESEVRWANAWPVRRTRYGRTLANALPYVQALSLERQGEFPHLAILLRTRSIKTLSGEIVRGHRRLSVLLLALAVAAQLPLVFFGFSALRLIIATAAPLGVFALIYVFVRAGVVRLPSRRVLNLQPVADRFTRIPDRRVTLVVGDEVMPRWSIRRPTTNGGRLRALYLREVPLLWRRFCPQLGNDGLRLSGSAVVREMWTEDIRKLLAGSAGE